MGTESDIEKAVGESNITAGMRIAGGDSKYENNSASEDAGRTMNACEDIVLMDLGDCDML